MFCLICFDISDDKARSRVVRELECLGVRVQHSVFECANLKERRFAKLHKKIESIIDVSRDTVRYYFLCLGCVPHVRYSGLGSGPVQAAEFKII